MVTTRPVSFTCIGLTADMAQGLWPNQEGASPDLNLPQQERVDRQMIRHLLGKYSREELGRLLQEEGRMSPSSSCKYFFCVYTHTVFIDWYTPFLVFYLAPPLLRIYASNLLNLVV